MQEWWWLWFQFSSFPSCWWEGFSCPLKQCIGYTTPSSIYRCSDMVLKEWSMPNTRITLWFSTELPPISSELDIISRYFLSYSDFFYCSSHPYGCHRILHQSFSTHRHVFYQQSYHFETENTRKCPDPQNASFRQKIIQLQTTSLQANPSRKWSARRQVLKKWLFEQYQYNIYAMMFLDESEGVLMGLNHSFVLPDPVGPPVHIEDDEGKTSCILVRHLIVPGFIGVRP